MSEPLSSEAAKGGTAVDAATAATETWQVHIIGPDEVYDHAEEINALRHANVMNRLILEFRKGQENNPNWPVEMAVVKKVVKAEATPA